MQPPTLTPALSATLSAAPPQSTDYGVLLRRVLSELKRHFGLHGGVSELARCIAQRVPTWLAEAAQDGPVILVLDGIEQLEDRDGAPDLAGCPTPSGGCARW